MKKIISMLIVLCMVFSLFSGVGFAAGDTITDEFGNEVIETPVEIEHNVKTTNNNEMPKDNIIITPYDFDLRIHEHYIENVGKTRINTFKVLTDYVRNDYAKNESAWPSVAFSEGESFTISASINTTAGVDADIVKAEIGSEVGVSKEYTASREYSFPVPYGYAGRVVYRYSYNYYTFDCVKEWHNGAKEVGEGDASSAPIGGASSYFALQKYYVF